MAWWFGRKSAPEVRPFVPVWLQGEGEAGGFALRRTWTDRGGRFASNLLTAVG